jgi:hypothetical protein
MAEGPAPATVSPSRPLGCETPRHPPFRRDSTETIGEASGLKALARLVLARDKRRDIERDEVSRAHLEITTPCRDCLDVSTARERDTETPITKTAPVADTATETRHSGNAGVIPRFGIPEIPDEPVLLRDGRRLWRFSQAQDCTPDRAAALIDQAYWCGAVLVADGCELIVVERWLSNLPIETLCELRRCASEVISVLQQRSRAPRHLNTPREDR